MADEYKAPKTTIEQDAPPEAAPASERFSAARTAGKLSAWFRRAFPGHENAVIFGALGLIAAILIFVVGVWRTLVIVLFVVAGVAIGQVADGDPKILRTVQRLLSGRRD